MSEHTALFAPCAAGPSHPRYEKLIERAEPLYDRDDDIRSPYDRDATRLLHCTAYRRLKHKTQVFPHVENDHICTRMEHVLHVDSVSHSIATYLGLDLSLTRAIAMGHDIGHAPFGHTGGEVLSEISQSALGKTFWHEANGVYIADNLELLEDEYGIERNLNLTYAVRDGIISHCGEVDENGLRPRENCFDLSEFRTVGQYPPATWEGCVVKVSDKIAYLGRDIEDAETLDILDETA